MKTKSKDSGKRRIGDDWNAIRIIALTQSNLRKSIANFVERPVARTRIHRRVPAVSNVIGSWHRESPGPGRRHLAASVRAFVDLAQEIVSRNRAKAS